MALVINIFSIKDKWKKVDSIMISSNPVRAPGASDTSLIIWYVFQASSNGPSESKQRK